MSKAGGYCKKKDSLLYRCFKAKYFFGVQLFRGKGHTKQLLCVEEHSGNSTNSEERMLLEGGRWSKIRVMKDKWILNHSTNMVLHPPVEEEWEWHVCKLIDW